MEESDYSKHEAWRDHVYAFGREAKRQWTQIIGGSFVFAVLAVFASVGFSLPPVAAGLAAFCGAFSWACFLAFCGEREKLLHLRGGRKPVETWDELKSLWRQSCELKHEWLSNRPNPPTAKTTAWADGVLVFCKASLTLTEIRKIDSPFQPQSTERFDDDQDRASDVNQTWIRLLNYERFLQEFLHTLTPPFP